MKIYSNSSAAKMNRTRQKHRNCKEIIQIYHVNCFLYQHKSPGSLCRAAAALYHFKLVTKTICWRFKQSDDKLRSKAATCSQGGVIINSHTVSTNHCDLGALAAASGRLINVFGFKFLRPVVAGLILPHWQLS